MVKGFVSNLNNLEGIDRGKPVGVYAFVPVDLSGGKKNPDVVGFIPVTDVEALKRQAHLSKRTLARSDRQAEPLRVQDPGKDALRAIDQGTPSSARRRSCSTTPCHPLPL